MMYEKSVQCIIISELLSWLVPSYSTLLIGQHWDDVTWCIKECFGGCFLAINIVILREVLLSSIECIELGWIQIEFHTRTHLSNPIPQIYFCPFQVTQGGISPRQKYLLKYCMV